MAKGTDVKVEDYMPTRREAIGTLMATATIALAGCATPPATDDGTSSDVSDAADDNTRTVRILATSDLHGKMVPWNYPFDAEELTGSMTQLSSAIKELRDEHTLLVDLGDTIQDNMAEVFVQDELHPMIACLNYLHYDVGVTGNHDYNYGMDVLWRAIKGFEGTVVTGNVYDERGKPVADGYTIIPVDGVRVGIVGMVTPNIARWDAVNLKDCTVTNPVEEARKIIDAIRDDVDVLVAALHMGLDGEYGTPGSGVREVVEACPEFDIVLGAHTHRLIEGEMLGNALMVENKFQAQTLAVVDLTFERAENGWKLKDKSSRSVDVSAYEQDPDMVELLAPYDERAKAYAHEVVGQLEGGPLAPEDEMPGVPALVTQDTALLDLVNDAQLHYSRADVSVTSPCAIGSNITAGDILRCDLSKAYKFNNTLYTIRATGAHLRKYLESSAAIFQQWHPGDVTLGFTEEGKVYNFAAAKGVTYTLDVSKEAGSRILDLSWVDGTPVADDDTFVLAVNNYVCNSELLAHGPVFNEGDTLPELLEVDIRGDIGGIRELLGDYIQNVRRGFITNDVDNSWHLVGNNWDPEQHERAIELVRTGKINLDDATNNGQFLCTRVLTTADL